MRRYTAIIFCVTLLFALVFITVQREIPSFSGTKDGYINNIRNYNSSFMLYIDDTVFSGYGNSQGYKTGDFVSINGEFSSVLSLENQSYGYSLRSKGVKYIVNSQQISVLEKIKPSFFLLPSLITGLTENTLNSLYGSKSALPKALLMGFSLDQSILKPFRDSGTAHILALSGFHIGFIFMFLSITLFFLPINYRWLVISVFLIFYCYITGMKPSIIRASSFFIIFFFCFKRSYRFDTLSILFIIASIMIGINPYSIFDAGFCLSFLCVASITMFSPIFFSLRKKYLPNLKSKLALYIINATIITISAQILSLPYSIHTFGNLPLLSIPANLLTLPLISLLMGIILLSLYFSFIMPFARLLASLGCIIIDSVLGINTAISSIKFSNVAVTLNALSAVLITLLMISIYLCYEYYQIRENINEI